MADLSKVIAALRCCLDESDDCKGCLYDGTERCVDAVMADALELLESIPHECPECAYSDRECNEEPCWSCVMPGTNWRWKYDSGSLEL